MSDLFVKTPKGIEEVTQRSHGLDMKARRVLIMIDGNRDQAALAAMIAGDGIGEILDRLVADGFVERQRSAEPEPAPAAAPALPPMDDTTRFKMARNFMVNTTNAFLGVVGSGLIDKLERSASLDELRRHYQDWQEGIRLSSEGRQRAPELEGQLAALLS
jgi:hypothetical protein